MAYRDRRFANQPGAAPIINILAGLWLIGSPWIYGRFSTDDPAVWSEIVVGALVVVFAATRLILNGRWIGLSWLNVILGAWTIASPWIYRFAPDTTRTGNAVVVGAIILLAALAATAPAQAIGEPYRDASGHGYGGPYGYGYGYGPYGYSNPPYGYPGTPIPHTGTMPNARSYGGEFRGRGPRGYRRPDEQIKNDICERMCESPELDATDIDVTVVNGEVILGGTVSSRHAKRLAEDIADSVVGVRDVHNEIRLPEAASQARRKIA